MNPMDLLNLFPKYPPIVNIALSLNVYIMVLALAYFIIKKIRMIGSLRTLTIFKDMTHRIQNYRIKEDKLQIKKNWKPKVYPQSIIPAKKSFRDYLKVIGFKQRDLVIAIEDLPETLTLRGVLSGDILKDIPKGIRSTILKQWTKDEVQKWMRKVLAQSIAERKMFKDTQFYMFLIVLLVNMVLLFMIANRMGVL